MGLFNIFGNGKEKKELYPKETKQDIVFGNLTRIGKASDWYTEKYCIKLFDKEYNVWIALGVEEKDSSITEEQHSSGKEFIGNIDKYQDIITEEVMKFFNIKDCGKIHNSIQVDAIRITRKGSVCLVMNCLEGADEDVFLQNHLVSKYTLK